MINNTKRIKIGLDFHGVITDNPSYFAVFTQDALQRGYEIHIITGGPASVVKQMLDDWKISYTTIFAILDFYEHLGQVKYFSNGEFKVEKTLWNTAKARYCAENGIDFHIDDSKVYAKWFSTPFCVYDGKLKKCRLNTSTQINLSGNPQIVLEWIGQISK